MNTCIHCGQPVVQDIQGTWRHRPLNIQFCYPTLSYVHGFGDVATPVR